MFLLSSYFFAALVMRYFTKSFVCVCKKSVTWWIIFWNFEIVLTLRVIFVLTEMSGEAKSSSRHVRTQHLLKSCLLSYTARVNRYFVNTRTKPPWWSRRTRVRYNLWYTENSDRVCCLFSHHPAVSTWFLFRTGWTGCILSQSTIL